MTNRNMKSCLISLIIREMQIKIMMRYHLTHVKTAITKRTTNKKCWQRKKEPSHVGGINWCSHYRKQYEGCSNNKKNYQKIQQVHSWVSICRKQNTNLKRYMHTYVHCNIMSNSKIWKQTKCSPIDR